jgi:hypothetical protein
VELDLIQSHSIFLQHRASGYTAGNFFSEDHSPMPRHTHQFMTLQVGAASFHAAADEAQRCAFAVGITDADFTDLNGNHTVLQFDKQRPEFWETHVEGFIRSFTIAAWVLRGDAKIWWYLQSWT